MVSVMLHAACFDKENSCDSWAEGGECEKNAAFMKEACPLACKICTPPPPKGTQPSALLQATDMEMRSSVDALLSQWAAEGQVAAAGAWS